ncbi:MAG: cytochrome P450 [Alphaproteobacteria bacterium]|nr:cytochrome P450 [Alphaproteobacteria bacterium]
MTVAGSAEDAFCPAMPPRPARPLPPVRMLLVAQQNSLAACDQELFDELFVARRLLGRRFFVISDPDGIRRVMQDNGDNYPRLSWIRRVFEFRSGSGMLHAEGAPWRRHRRIINPTLDYRAMLADLPLLVELAEEMGRHLARQPAGQPIDTHEAFRALVTISAGHIFTGADRALDPMLDHMGQYPGPYGLFDLLPPPRRLRFLDLRRKTRIEAARYAPLLDRLVAERRSENYSGSRDLIWRLANAQDRDTGERLSVGELHDEILTLGATSATSLRPIPWIWYLLATHPWAEEKLHAELDRVLGGRAPDAADLAKLVYLRQVLDETMRLYPPLPIMMMRIAAADDIVCGRRIPRKSIVSIVPWVVHRHRKLWHDPDRFDPERFGPEPVAARSRYAYLPFAVGPHVCVGASMAMLQLVATVAVLAQRFRFRLVPGRLVEPTAWTNIRPKSGMWMTVEPRSGAPGQAA